jgi:glycosyltransferase involved in cell wall biosynthesis
MSTPAQLPLVSCIMPTCDRRWFVERAIGYFLKQDYARSELIIVDDGSDFVGDLAVVSGRIRYIRLNSRHTVGTKRNLACQRALGSIIAHWDDDDWHAPHRLTYQVEALLARQADICGLVNPLFYDLRQHAAWQFVYPSGNRPWLSGSSLCYTRSFWERNQFADVDVSEDTRFVWNASANQVVELSDPTFHVGMIHNDNVSQKRTEDPFWHTIPPEHIQTILGADWVAYAAMPTSSRVPVSSPAPIGPAEVKDWPDTPAPQSVARQAHLELPEYAAFNFRTALPWMRRWELPFALFQARLPTSAIVLDCTINPSQFQQRLKTLYPYVAYSHVSPIHNGQFRLPLLPEQAFDRVFCVNTLEHLLQPQRAALIAVLARALKPTGLLVLTSDYYFDSSWQQPAFLQAGVMRQDGSEIFNGWNKIRPADWLELCSPHNLAPLRASPPEPVEGDPGLYCNQPPFRHASIGGVFRGPEYVDSPRRRVVFGLLVWNTRDVSLDSARAQLREARLLVRLGHEAAVCICDNGSTDGTPEALRAFAEACDVPCKLILNSSNLGNCIARNQIIDSALESGADYLLMTDGDIELVPFSSFAMLRHMEDSGRTLGCLGADHWGQTPARDQAAPYLYSVNDCRIELVDQIAYTQYGLFRREVFEDGVRFEEQGPFGGPGWGYEDNDLAFQMLTRGYSIQGFSGMTYLHREIRSSVRLLRDQGVDTGAVCASRQRYVVDKWSNVGPIRDGPLAIVSQLKNFV